MQKLQYHDIHMNQHVDNKEQALVRMAQLLYQAGLTQTAYLSGLQQRELQSSTYLGQGIAIPHGTPQSRDAIINTGLCVAHFPQGIDWDGENTVYLVIAIAAKSDEHLQVLQRLTKALTQDISDQIRQATDAEQILQLLTGENRPQLYLHEHLIHTQVAAQDMDDLVWQAYQALKQADAVEQGFIQQLDFSQLIDLGDGVWTISSQAHSQFPAISVSTTSQNILYKNQPVKVLICIANHPSLDLARFDALMQVLLDPIQRQMLVESHDRRQIAILIGAEQLPDWASQQVIIANAHGLHARPATALVNQCKGLKGDIKVSVDGQRFVSAKSLSQLLSLGAKHGQTLTFIAEPKSDAEQHLDQIIQAVASGLGEEVQAIAQPSVEQPANPSPHRTHTASNTASPAVSFADFMRNKQQQQPHGVPASTGIAYAQTYIVEEQHFEFETYSSRSIYEEQQQLQHAIDAVKQQLQQTIDHSENNEIKQIFTAHIALLEDPDILQQVDTRLQQKHTAAAAWHDYIEQIAQQQQATQDSLMAERAADLRDIGRRVMAQLCGVEQQSEPEQAYILVKADITPSDVAQLNRERVAGIFTALGGVTAHSAIVARALGIPAIVGVGLNTLQQIRQGDFLLINGDTGEFTINPEAHLIEQAMIERHRQDARRQSAQLHCQEPAISQDQHQIEIAANVANVRDAEQAVNDGAEAIGLLRTELLMMNYAQLPDDETQQTAYRAIFDAMQGRPVVVRTLDVGGDKPLPFLPIPHESNPFLGLRGMRLTLRRPELLQQQLKNLIIAAEQRPLRIMFPMVGQIEEWRSAKAILDDVLKQYPCENLQVGIMIEVPSAALLSPILAKEVDFFSIGTNDLTQYVLAIDRDHPLLSQEADGLHPSVLQLIDLTVKSAHKQGKWVGICGELASDAQAIPILLGLGIDELSMSSRNIALAKAQIRELNYQKCQHLAEQALALPSANDVRQLSKSYTLKG